MNETQGKRRDALSARRDRAHDRAHGASDARARRRAERPGLARHSPRRRSAGPPARRRDRTRSRPSARARVSSTSTSIVTTTSRTSCPNRRSRRRHRPDRRDRRRRAVHRPHDSFGARRRHRSRPAARRCACACWSIAGLRELPIQPDYVGRFIPTSRREHIDVSPSRRSLRNRRRGRDRCGYAVA